MWRELEKLLTAMGNTLSLLEGESPRWLVERKDGRTLDLPLELQSSSLQAGGPLLEMLATTTDPVERNAIKDWLRFGIELERSVCTHASAYFILLTSILFHFPFALYLRNFEKEGAPTVFERGKIVL